MKITQYAAGVKGTKALNGSDESQADFDARKGAVESQESFIKRSLIAETIDTMTVQIDEKLKSFTENDPEFKGLKSLKEKVDGLKFDETIVEKLKNDIKEQGITIEALKKASVGEDRGIKKGSIAETLAKHKEQIDAFTSGKASRALTIEHKASAQTETSTDITSRDYYIQWHEGGRVGQIPVRKPFIRSLFKNQQTESEYIRYTDQNTVVRDAQNVALCATSTGNTKATWITRSMQIGKVRDFIDICTDMMTNYLFVQGEVQNLLDTSVKLKIDDQLLNGTGVSPQLNSISAIASTWAPNIAGITDYTGTIFNANLINLIAIAGKQIQQLGQMNAWMPNYVFVNPGDLEIMKNLKNTLGDSVRMYPGMFVDNGGNVYINGMLLIENPNITSNTFWIGDFTRGTVYAIPGVGIEFSYENATNFETETVTVKAYERLNLLIRNVDTNAFMKCTDITAALAQINKV